MRSYRIDIPLYEKELEIPVLEYMQGDIGGKLFIKLMDQDLKEFDIENCTAIVIYEKRDSEIIQNNVEIKDNTLNLDIHSFIIDTPGKVKIQLKIYKDKERITTHIFQLQCSKVLDFEGAVDGYDKFDIIQTISSLGEGLAELKLYSETKFEEVNETIISIDKKLEELKSYSETEFEQVNKTMSDTVNNIESTIKTVEKDLNDNIETREISSNKGKANGYAALDEEGTIPVNQVPKLDRYPVIIISEEEPLIENLAPGTFWLQPLIVEDV